VSLVTGGELASSPELDHHVTKGRGTFAVTLADGRRFADDGFDVVFNRLQGGEVPWFGGAADEDREYAMAETYAAWMSLLRSFRSPVVNPVGPRGLAGPGKSQLEWLALAADCGLPVREAVFTSSARRHSTRALAPHELPEDTPLAASKSFTGVPIHALGRRPGVFLEPFSSELESYLVLGESVVGNCPEKLMASSVRLSKTARCPLLEISVARFGDDGVQKKVFDVNPLPRLDGWTQVRAVCDLLESMGQP
jgi:hypothetical protein